MEKNVKFSIPAMSIIFENWEPNVDFISVQQFVIDTHFIRYTGLVSGLTKYCIMAHNVMYGRYITLPAEPRGHWAKIQENHYILLRYPILG